MAEWQTFRLGTIVSTNQSTYSPKEAWQFVNYLDTGSITMNRVDEIQYINTSTDKLPSRARRKVKLNSIIYSTVRPNQLHYGIIKKQPENFLVSTGFAVIDVDFEKAVPDYIYYVLTQQEVTEHLQAIAEQSVSAYPSIKPSDIENLELLLPDRKTQGKIVAILSSIDEKIKQNNEINNNLEQQAQAFFAEWHKNNIDESEEVSLGDVCIKVTDGSHFSPKDELQSSIPMLSVKDMEKYDFNFSACKHISEIDYSKMIANDCVPQVDDILVAKDGSYLKEIFICNEQRKLAILSSIAIFRPNQAVITPEILLAFLKSPAVLREVRDNYVSGSALPRIVLKDFKKLRFLLPKPKKQAMISPILSTFRRAIAENVKESQRLQSIRDTLLPSLMSGELDVSDIDL